MNNQELQNKYSQKEEIYFRAKKRVDRIKGFYWHLFWYLVVNLFLIILIGYSTNSFWHFAPYSTAFFWGIGLFFHFLGVYGSNLLFGKAWEQKQIEKFMREDQKNNQL